MAENLTRLDANQLQTALATAIAAEDYVLAAAIRDRMETLAASDGGGGPRSSTLDWQAMGVVDWVADRAARLGLRFPTGAQAPAPCSAGSKRARLSLQLMFQLCPSKHNINTSEPAWLAQHRGAATCWARGAERLRRRDPV
jgi:hypothetical protein